MKKLSFLLLFCLAAIYLSAQLNSGKHKDFNIPRSAVVDPALLPPDFNPVLQNMEMPHPGSGSYRGYLLQLKQEMAQRYPGRYKSKNIGHRSAFPQPTIERGFKGNSYNNSGPNDNNMAIENGGKVLPTHYPKGLKISAKFGFPIQHGQSDTIPEAIKQATLIQASRFWQRRISPMGFSGNPETGQAPVIFLSQLDPDVQTLIRHFKVSTITLASGRPYTGLNAVNNQRQYGV